MPRGRARGKMTPRKALEEGSVEALAEAALGTRVELTRVYCADGGEKGPLLGAFVISSIVVYKEGEVEPTELEWVAYFYKVRGAGLGCRDIAVLTDTESTIFMSPRGGAGGRFLRTLAGVVAGENP